MLIPLLWLLRETFHFASAAAICCLSTKNGEVGKKEIHTPLAVKDND